MKIDHDVPLPNAERTNTRWPWPNMDEGDSFFIPCPADKARAKGNAVSVTGQGFCARNKPGYRIVFRQVDGGVRVWMVKSIIRPGG